LSASCGDTGYADALKVAPDGAWFHGCGYPWDMLRVSAHRDRPDRAIVIAEIGAS
jgi:hypothetical protein